MQAHHIRFCSFILLLNLSSLLFSATPYFSIRSQSAHLPLEMVGQENPSNSYLSLGLAFSQSFKKDDIVRCIFGPYLSNCDQITISGSSNSGRGANDWLADYFGLPTDFKSVVTLSPRIRNVMFYGNIDLTFKDWPGFYLKIEIPFVSTRWKMGFCEEILSKGTADYAPGYFNSNGTDPGVSRSNLLNSFEEFVVQNQVPNIDPTINLAPSSNEQILTPVTFLPLANARISCDSLSKSGLADVRFAFGYNYICDGYHVGCGLAGAIPTGNRPKGDFVFEPILGNGRHWELGGQVTGHYEFWRCAGNEKILTGHLAANFTHMFNSRQTRTFDLKGKPNSRYMLAQKMGTPVYKLLFTTNDQTTYIVSSPTIPAQFKDVFIPVANLTTVDVDVKIGLQADVVAMLNFTIPHFSFDLGYNLWARSCEKITLNCKCPNSLSDGKTWALKGDAQVYGFGPNNDHVVPLSGTQSNATILSGANAKAATASVIASRNPGVDSAQIAATNSIAAELLNTSLTSGLTVFTSKDPIFITLDDLDLEGAQTKGLSHTIFGSFSYEWCRCDGYEPFIGAGFAAEVLQSKNDCNDANDNNCCDSSSCCNQCGLSQWTLWIKGGVAF